MSENNKISFKEWCKLVDTEHFKYSASDVSITEETGSEFWREYYDMNYSPEQAYFEDCSNV